MKALHFGVHCSDCGMAEVSEIPSVWLELEPAQVIILLAQGEGAGEPEDNMQAADDITDFLEVHESHGAMPVTLSMEEIFNGREKA